MPYQNYFLAICPMVFPWIVLNIRRKDIVKEGEENGQSEDVVFENYAMWNGDAATANTQITFLFRTYFDRYNNSHGIEIDNLRKLNEIVRDTFIWW